MMTSWADRPRSRSRATTLIVSSTRLCAMSRPTATSWTSRSLGCTASSFARSTALGTTTIRAASTPIASSLWRTIVGAGDDLVGEARGEALQDRGDRAESSEVVPPVLSSPDLVPLDDEPHPLDPCHHAERDEVQHRHLVSQDHVEVTAEETERPESGEQHGLEDGPALPPVHGDERDRWPCSGRHPAAASYHHRIEKTSTSSPRCASRGSSAA